MKNLFVRVERALVAAVTAKELRPLEKALARKVLVRFVTGLGLSSAVTILLERVLA